MFKKENWDLLANDSSYCNLQLVTRQRNNFQEKMNMWQRLRMSLIKKPTKNICQSHSQFFYFWCFLNSRCAQHSSQLQDGSSAPLASEGVLTSAHLFLAVPLASCIAVKACRHPQKQGGGIPCNPLQDCSNFPFNSYRIFSIFAKKGKMQFSRATKIWLLGYAEQR